MKPKIIRVEDQKGNLYAYILTQKTKLESMPEWKKKYFGHSLTDSRRGIREAGTVAPRSVKTRSTVP